MIRGQSTSWLHLSIDDKDSDLHDIFSQLRSVLGGLFAFGVQSNYQLEALYRGAYLRPQHPNTTTTIITMATGPVQGLQLFPDAMSKAAIDVEFDADEFNDSVNWIISPSSKQFGVPVKIGRYEVPDEAQEVNETATHLFLCTDITSPFFALPPRNPFRGSVVIVRCDGQDLDETTVNALAEVTVEYINAARHRFDQVKSGALDIDVFYAEAKAQLTREKAAHRYQILKDGDTGYMNPFEASTAGGIRFCDSCGAVRTASGGALLLCGVCGEGRYCSQDCQKREWKVHKEVHRKP